MHSVSFTNTLNKDVNDRCIHGAMVVISMETEDRHCQILMAFSGCNGHLIKLVILTRPKMIDS